jgi:hypothetical protein
MCVRMHGLRSNANTVARTAKVKRSPVSPHLTRPARAVICGRPYGARSTIDTGSFERRPVTCMSINRSLGSFGPEFFFLGDF